MQLYHSVSKLTTEQRLNHSDKTNKNGPLIRPHKNKHAN